MSTILTPNFSNLSTFWRFYSDKFLDGSNYSIYNDEGLIGNLCN